MDYHKYIKRQFGLKQKKFTQAGNFTDLLNLWFPPAKNHSYQQPMSSINSSTMIHVPRQEVVALRKRNQRFSGVYFLLNEEVIVYIGKSVNILERLAVHCRNKEKEFNGCSYIIARRDIIEELERFLIEILRPKYNIEYNPSKP